MAQQGREILLHMPQERPNEEEGMALEKAKMQRQLSGESTASTADPVAWQRQASGESNVSIAYSWQRQASWESTASTADPMPCQLPGESTASKTNVVVKHAMSGQKITVSVPTSATMKDVTAAASQALGRPDIATKGRLVRHIDSGFITFKEEENLGARRLLLIIGIDDLAPAQLVLNDPKSGSPPREKIQEQPETAVTPVQAKAEAANDVMVTVKHAVNDKEKVVVTVSSAARMKDVKSALSELLGRPELLTKTRLVQRSGKIFTSLADSEKIGSRRNLLLMGVDDLQPAACIVQDNGEVELDHDKVLAMTKEFHSAYMNEGFQRKIHGLAKKYGVDSRSFASERAVLVQEVQEAVVPRHGFEATPKTSRKVLNALQKWRYEDNELSHLSVEIDAALRLAAQQKPCEADKNEVELDHDKLLAMSKDFLTAYMSDVFQSKINELAKQYGVGSRNFASERAVLVQEVQEAVMPRHGFEATPKANRKIMKCFQEWSEKSSELSNLSVQINAALRLPVKLYSAGDGYEFLAEGTDEAGKWLPCRIIQQGSLPNTYDIFLFADNKEYLHVAHGKIRQKPVETEQAEIIVAHAVNHNEGVTVSVPVTAILKDVREAVAKKLARPEVLNSGHFVQAASDNSLPIADSEKVGKCRTFWMVGLNNLKPGPKAVMVMSRQDALAMQKELYARFSSETFQKSLRALGMKKKEPQYIHGRAELVFEVQKEVIPKFGFGATVKGAKEMVKVLDEYAKTDSEFRSLATHINVLLGVHVEQPTEMSREDAFVMQKALRDGFSSATFQKSLMKLGSDTANPNYQGERAMLVAEVHKEVIPRFGFEPTGRGSRAMKQILDCFSDVDPEFAKLRDEINSLLRVHSSNERKET